MIIPRNITKIVIQGRAPFNTSTIVIPVIPLVTNKLSPTGGVTIPISIFTTMIIPRCIGSIPSSIAIGNTHKIEIMKGWEESAVLYLSIVGKRGTNKSHPLSWALKPIENRDDVAYQRYLVNKEKYHKASDMTQQEREEQGHV